MGFYIENAKCASQKDVHFQATSKIEYEEVVCTKCKFKGQK